MIKCKCGLCYDIPTLCHVETTYKCNQNCVFCYNPQRESLIDYNKLGQIIRSVVDAKIPHVYLSGGEPSLLEINKLNEYIGLLKKHSSITVLTNGQITMKELDKDIACLGIPLHGRNADEHEKMTQVKGSFDKTINSIKYYVKNGYDVRCILVLTGYNYDKIYDLIKLADSLGMESVYVDRYEDGGIGASNSNNFNLRPTNKQFRIALSQMIKARKKFKRFVGRIGFGTAIPYCLDKRLIKENMACNCGVGTNFCAINLNGDFRICNQSQVVFGNVIKTPIKEIWSKKDINCFRDLSWVEEPCRSCKALIDCCGGCKVDVNYSDKFSIDYAVRRNPDKITLSNINFINKKFKQKENVSNFVNKINKKQIYKISKYLKINNENSDILLITRYQTIVIDKNVQQIINWLWQQKHISFSQFYAKFIEDYNIKEIKRIFNVLILAGAVINE